MARARVARGVGWRRGVRARSDFAMLLCTRRGSQWSGWHAARAAWWRQQDHGDETQWTCACLSLERAHEERAGLSGEQPLHRRAHVVDRLDEHRLEGAGVVRADLELHADGDLARDERSGNHRADAWHVEELRPQGVGIGVRGWRSGERGLSRHTPDTCLAEASRVHACIWPLYAMHACNQLLASCMHATGSWRQVFQCTPCRHHSHPPAHGCPQLQ